jgi:hypothetical protein
MSRVADACESSGCGVGGASLFARRPPHGWEALPAVQHICISWGVAEIRQEKAEHSVSEVWSPIPDFCARVTLSEPSILRCPVGTSARTSDPEQHHLRSARLAAPSAFV